MISMQIFYAPGITADHYTLDESESKHIIRVLRMKKGTLVKLIDGRGNLYEGVIADPDPKKCLIRITSVFKDFEKRSYSLHIGISPIKNPDRFEWFVEKSVELGIDEITPVICKNSEKKTVKAERINNIIISAMKQSLKANRTIFHRLTLFHDFIAGYQPGDRMIAHCNSRMGLRSGITEVYNKGDKALILIGPEGDFTEEEITGAIINGFRPVHLGNSRLRTETAGLSACHSIYFINQ